jgi:GNAT superfamily N-acetyltransferase
LSGTREQSLETVVQIVLRPATKSDASFVLNLEEICMRQYAEALWGGWLPTDTADNVDLTGHEIVEQDGLDIGCVANTWHEDHLFIEKLYIAPNFQRRGIGANVLRIKVGQAAQRLIPTKLSVLTTNPADRFYLREGFALEPETPERRLFIKGL